MKKRVFFADKDGTVEVLGMELDARPEDLKVFINGSEITESIMVERIEIVVEKKKVE